MRRLLYLAVALVLAVVLLFGLALALVDAQALTEPLAERASLALGQPVELGAIDLDLLPVPAARVRHVRVGGAAGEPALAEIEEIRLRVSLPALLIGRVALRRLEVDAPHIRLELGDDGRPVVPAPAATGPATPEPSDAADQADAPLLAITSFAVRDGIVEAGPWKAEGVSLDGSLGFDRSVDVSLEADLPGLGTLRDVRVELTGLGDDAPDWSAAGELGEIDLAAAAARLPLPLDAQLAGRADARFEGTSRDGVIESAALELTLRGVELRSDALELEGDVEASAALGGAWRVDLTDAVVSDSATLRKPRAAPLAVEGELAEELDPDAPLAALGAAELTLGEAALGLHLDLGAAPRVRLGPGEIELAPLADWWLLETAPTAGALALQDLELALEPLSARGGAELRDVTLALEHGEVSVSGPLRGAGPELRGEGLRVVIGGQTALVDASYDLASGRVASTGEIADAELEPLLAALQGSAAAMGTLRADFALSGPPDPAALSGHASFEVAPGRLRGFSLLEAVVGELAAIPLLVARAKGLSRLEEEDFKRAAGRVRLEPGLVRVDSLDLEYRHSRSALRGTVRLADEALDLRGEVVLSREADAELAGQDRGRERVIPISVGGTLSRPRVRLDRDVVAGLVASYTGGGGVREKLEEKLGSEGADAVQDLLEGIFGGGRER